MLGPCEENRAPHAGCCQECCSRAENGWFRSVNKRHTNGDPRSRPWWKIHQGQRGGPGNPFAAEVGKHRARLFKAARARDVDQALKTIREIMTKGKDGDRLAAAKLLLDRLIGPAVELDILERLEALETAIAKGRRL